MEYCEGCDSSPGQSALKDKNREICDIRAFVFFKYEGRCNLIDVPGQIYDRKTAARRFDTIHDILRVSVSRNPLSKAKNPN